MDIKQKYREEFNKDVFSEDCCMQPTASYSDEYVRWLEKQVKNCSIPDVVGQSEQLKCSGCKKPLYDGLCGSCCSDLASGMY